MNNGGLPRREKSLILASRRESLELEDASANMRRLFGSPANIAGGVIRIGKKKLRTVAMGSRVRVWVIRAMCFAALLCVSGRGGAAGTAISPAARPWCGRCNSVSRGLRLIYMYLRAGTRVCLARFCVSASAFTPFARRSSPIGAGLVPPFVRTKRLGGVDWPLLSIVSSQ